MQDPLRAPLATLPPATPAELLVAAIPDGVLAFDLDFRYTAWNPAMEAITGVPAVAVLGRVAWEVFPFLAETGEDALFVAAVAGEERTSSDRPFVVPQSGRAGYFQGRYAPLRDAEGVVVGGMAVIRDVTESRRAEESLRLQGSILASMSEGVSVSDENGIILYTNPAEDRIFGYAPGELVGMHVSAQNAYPPEENQRIVGEVIDTLKRDGVWTGEWLNRRRDGTPFSTYARITALEMGGRCFWVCVQADITEKKRAEAERDELLARERAARREAEEANRAKAEFLATMSHELRTPLNAIAGYAELMEMELHGPVTDEQRNDLGRIRRNQSHLLALIENILSFARLEAGHAEFRFQEVPLAGVLEDLDAVVAPQVRAKGLLFAHLLPDPALAVRGDPERIHQVLVNLVTNAIKFTPPGGRVSVACERVDGCVAIRVADTGRGIPADRLEAIFEPFVQVDRAQLLTGASQPGVGLGLAISRELARGMGGTLSVASVVGEGSVFTMTLPAAD